MGKIPLGLTIDPKTSKKRQPWPLAKYFPDALHAEATYWNKSRGHNLLIPSKNIRCHETLQKNSCYWHDQDSWTPWFIFRVVAFFFSLLLLLTFKFLPLIDMQVATATNNVMHCVRWAIKLVVLKKKKINYSTKLPVV